MAQTEDVIIGKVTNGLERPAPNEDSTCGLVIGGIAATGLALNTPKLLYSLEDAENIGITAAYDTANKVLVHHHISEFYRLAAGQPLYLLLVAQATTLAQMCDKASANGLEQLRIFAQGKLRVAGTVLSPVTGYTPTITTGIADDVLAAIPKAQQLSDNAWDLHAPLDVVIEGRAFAGASLGTTIDLKTFDMESVSVVVAQDLDISGSDVLHNTYAAVGTYLGEIAAKPTVADSPAEVGVNLEGDIQSLADSRFKNYGMANKALSTFSDSPAGGDQQGYRDKHFVTLKTYPETKGVYFRQSFTCAAATNDILTIELSRTYNKAHRELHKKYVPFINKKFRLTPDGKLPAEVVADFENIGNKVFITMAENLEISIGKTYINPAQVIATTRRLVVKWKIVPMGYADTIEGELSYALNIE